MQSLAGPTPFSGIAGLNQYCFGAPSRFLREAGLLRSFLVLSLAQAPRIAEIGCHSELASAHPLWHYEKLRSGVQHGASGAQHAIAGRC
jgi:hypothetical protein